MSLQTIIRAIAPTAHPLDGIVLDPNVMDGPDPDDIVENVQEVFCLACHAPVAPFESFGGELMHYAGDPMTAGIQPFETDHAPFLP